jgi:hypothetical protein
MATNGSLNHSDQFTTASAAPSIGSNADQTTTTNANSNLGKDEVAWYFVEQYYTTLSKTPEKLHLFYGKRSQFVYGREAEVAPVSLGRQEIQARIKDLDFQDCKVRVSNVDSQATFESIVIQVIGETSNKAGDPKKFVQTFVLAQQPSGYFVLNDIFRYVDDGEEEPAEPAPEAEAPEEAPAVPATEEVEEQPEETKQEPAEEPAAPAIDASAVDQKLEDVTKETSSSNGAVAAEIPTETSKTVPETTPQPTEEKAADPETTAQELAEEDIKQPERPADPSPTPVPKPQAVAPAPAPAPAQPPKPMTWASRAAAAAAAAAGPRPAVPLPKAATPTPAQPRPAAATQAAATQPAASQNADVAPAAAPAKEASEWQTAGSDSKRQNRPQSISGPQSEKEGTLGYVKYVTEKVKHDDLKAALAQHGELSYLDINRQKNCAFVEFVTPAGYQAAVAANPHIVNGESITVELRRPKSTAYGGSNYNTGRGNAANRGGRGGFDGRSGSQSGGRGGFGGQNRGRGGATRGRGGAQATNA